MLANVWRVIALVWGAGGFFLLLCFTIYRLSPFVCESVLVPWHWWHHIVWWTNIGAMAWFEGYRGFQCAFSPRFGARASVLWRSSTPLQAALAPLILMGFLQAPRRRVLTAVFIAVGVTMIVFVYKLLPQPWRGILDAGVIVGLAWGLVATIWSCIDAIMYQPIVDPEVI